MKPSGFPPPQPPGRPKDDPTEFHKPRPQPRTLAISSLTPGPMVELKLTFLM